jgi:hypothetical protein
MPQGEQFDHEPALPQPASQSGSLTRDECRAARIDDVTAFAECLEKTETPCPHRMTFNAYLYCLHPQREVIIARTSAEDGHPEK